MLNVCVTPKLIGFILIGGRIKMQSTNKPNCDGETR